MALLAMQKGRLVGGAKPNVPLVRWQKLLTTLLFFKGVRECFAFHFFLCGGVFYFFLGLACVSPSWSVHVWRNTAKLSTVLRSPKKFDQDVKSRWFSCLVDGGCVVFQACLQNRNRRSLSTIVEILEALQPDRFKFLRRGVARHKKSHPDVDGDLSSLTLARWLC